MENNSDIGEEIIVRLREIILRLNKIIEMKNEVSNPIMIQTEQEKL